MSFVFIAWIVKRIKEPTVTYTPLFYYKIADYIALILTYMK
jgi:hypothetical protein